MEEGAYDETRACGWRKQHVVGEGRVFTLLVNPESLLVNPEPWGRKGQCGKWSTGGTFEQTQKGQTMGASEVLREGSGRTKLDFGACTQAL